MNRLAQIPEPVVFAHRGASAYSPENTLVAFKLALEMGAPAIELDAKLSKDGVVMVIHDQSVNRTTDGNGLVRHLTCHQLQGFDAGTRYNRAFHGVKIPTLEEVLTTFQKTIYINIELTNYDSPFDALPVKVADLVRCLKLEEYTLFSSFNPFNLMRIKRLLPEIPVAILAYTGMTGIFHRSFLAGKVSPHIIHPHYSDVNSSFTSREKKRKRRIHAYTVNTEQEIRRLNSLGIAGVFTDDPKLALRMTNPG